MILGAHRKQGLVVNPAANSKHKLINEKGPGVFVSATLSKQGGVNDITQAALFIDGQNVVAITFAAADNIGLDEANNSGTKMVKGALIDNLTIQYNEPLYYRESCVIEVSIGSDTGVVQIVSNAVLGKECKYPA